MIVEFALQVSINVRVFFVMLETFTSAFLRLNVFTAPECLDVETH